MSSINIDSAHASETFGQDASFRLEQPIGAMSISPSGRDVVLASKEGLHIVDLDSPYSPPRHLPHRTPWEVADVQWSPFAARDYWIVSTSNQKALVWNVGAHGWNDAIEFVLHGHTRAITDINFSAYHPDVLATCAVDSFVHGWDLRSPSRPAFSFSDWFAGATQVKWSRQDEHVIASSHDRFLHIWDKRKGAYPARTIEAHGTKIYGLDWNRFEPSKIVTCSLDKTVKFWNTSSPEDTPERVIETPFPVWRARHTPFGWGLLAMPQRGNSDLHLYDRRPLDGILPSGQVRPVTTFRGHKGQVKEFLWRSRGTINDGIDFRDFQLVSWGTDRELRLHRIPDGTLHDIGYEKGVSRTQRLNLTRRGARYRTFRDAVTEPYSPSEYPIRTDSFPVHNQSLSIRPRPSTNVGMSKVSVAQFRGWLHSGRRERRTGMHGKVTTRQDMNPIAWMKNVKIDSWDLDSLADEITQVGDKFNRIEFESVDIGQRRAIVSLQGPWGKGAATVYVRVEFRFPKTYPRDANAVIHVQKTNAIEPSIHRMLATEVHTIAETYASRQRGCIEAVVRYLLHEQSMEQIVSWLLGEGVVDSKILGDEIAADDISSDSDDDNLNGIADPSNSSANIRMPLPKACGALWSNDGQLVCFFPRKSNEPISVLTRPGAANMEESQSSRLFENFGRLHSDSPTRKPANGTHDTADDTASDNSDVVSMFSSSSSSSSSSSEAGAALRNGFARYIDTNALGMRHRSRSGDRSNRSTTMDGIKTDEETRLNFVSIHREMRDLLPSQKHLAQDYRIVGNPKEVCEHNAGVAQGAMLPDVASIWRLAALILEQRISEVTSKPSNEENVESTLVARRSPTKLRWKDNPMISDEMFEDRSHHNHPKAKITWGNSPLASAYLITAIFNYFEQAADIQTLAILSFIFTHAHQTAGLRTMTSTKAGQNQHLYFPSGNIPWSVSRSMKQDKKDHSSAAAAAALARNTTDHQPNISEISVQHQRRQPSQIDIAATDKSTLRVTVREPSVVIETSGPGVPNMNIKAASASASSEEHRLRQRTTSGLAFAASRASLNALAQSYSNSPPSNNSTAASSFKKLSPSASLASGNWSGVLFSRDLAGRNARTSLQLSEATSEETYGSNLRSSISSVSLHDLRRDGRHIMRNRASLRSAHTVTNDKQKHHAKSKKRITRTSMHNQDRFDLEGHADQPLLDPQLQWRYRAWRINYAELLEVWGLWLQRAEMLQFDGQSDVHVARGERRASSKLKPDMSAQRLDIVRCCHECGNPFAPIQRNGVAVGWHCTSLVCLLVPRKVSKHQICSICEKIVRGLSVPCLQCGHITCYNCAESWFVDASQPLPSDKQSAVDRDDIATDACRTYQQPCPTGCGCVCTIVSHVSVPYPESNEDDGQRLLAEPPSLRRHLSAASDRSIRFRPGPAPDTALGSMMAISSRSRAASTITKSHVDSASVNTEADARQQMDELVPWASGKFTTLGRGIGGGLSRGLSNRSSDATIRRA